MGCGTIDPKAFTSMGSWTSVRKGSFIAALADHADHHGPPPTCAYGVVGYALAKVGHNSPRSVGSTAKHAASKP
jgi:hypothetical protein